MDTSFNSFWNTYDKKVGIDKCKPKWMLLSGETREKIMVHLKKFIPANRNKQFRPDPTTYINQRKWEDELINSKTEEKEVYIPHDNSPNRLKDFKARAFNRNEWREMVQKQIEHFLNTGEYSIPDYGNVIHHHLTQRGILKLPDEIKEQIRGDLTFEATRHRTRREKQYNGCLEADIKWQELKEFLTICRKDKRDILTELKTND
ncbi:MAG: hypothetical protein ACUZ8E_07030 [Candidatus Anammoxibacter sp.]